jgi:hypothetical protein
MVSIAKPKPKPEPEPKPKPKPAKPPEPEGMTTRGVRMTAKYGAWIDKLAASERISVASLIDRALANYAKLVRFEEEPPERVK